MSLVFSWIVGIVAAGIGFIILYPILGVTLWISFLVAACLLVPFGASVGMKFPRATAH
ncbi:MAG TPA: hypothetical protein VMG37_10730 [Solirubrobacteraceae bacterium]|nr:hypothetical protein [Solirubrobacteraceae bacterium]